MDGNSGVRNLISMGKKKIEEAYKIWKVHYAPNNREDMAVINFIGKLKKIEDSP